MKTHALRLVLQTLALVLGASLPSQAQSSKAVPADAIVLHGRVYTENAKQPWAQAVAIRGAKIVAVGSDAEIDKMRAVGTKVIDASGGLVLPGFVDSHIHFMDGSLSLGRVNLEGAKDASDIQQRLREYASDHPGDGWILGRGWNYAMFGPEALPHKKYLDEIFPNRPVFLEGYDGHTYWANSKALALAGITRETPDPPNGAIVRDPKTGEATGALKESAQELVAKIVIAYFLNPPQLRPQDLETIESARKKYHDDWIDAGAVKFMVDGVVESHTAAMLEPYSDDPSVKGKLFWEPSNYKAAVTELDKRGLQLFTHAIGEYGVRTALDAYENSENLNHTRDGRPRIEHIETIAPADIPRFGKLGVIASMQPLHSYPDSNTLNVWARNVGPERASRAWSWKSISDTGGRLAFGSDWPVVTLNPWEGVETAVTRQTADGTPEAGFVPGQRLTVAQTIAGYTLGAAFAGRREKWEGSLEPEKFADLIIVSQNVFEMVPQKLAETRVLTTMVGGQVVYQADAK